MVPLALVDLLAPSQQSYKAGRVLRQFPTIGPVNNHDVYVLPHFAGQSRYSSFQSSVVNARTALLERVFYHEIGGVFSAPMVPTAHEVAGVLSAFYRLMKYRVNRLTPVPLLEYPQSAYRGRKLALYTKAAGTVSRDRKSVV